MSAILQSLVLFAATTTLFSTHSVLALSIPQPLLHEQALWVPETFDPLVSRDAPTCGGDSSLSPCGGSFPSDFCCGQQTTCLQLNTSSTIVAALCCPAGSDCGTISPINCDQSFQNATSNPTSPLHASPPTQLQTCGSACCPMGYLCSGGRCFASASSNHADPGLTTSSTSPSTPSSTGSSPDPAVPSSAPSSADATASASSSASPAGSTGSSESPTSAAPLPPPSAPAFSGKSFAAGFVPGIALGVLFALGATFLVSRRNRRRSESYVNEKHNPTRDTLTELGPDLDPRPTMHGRSISEPTADPNLGHRTEFLQFTPPRGTGSSLPSRPMGNSVEIRSPATGPAPSEGYAPKVKALFSRSPFLNQAQTPIPTQAPLPEHLKRGTLSYQITPVRGLKKQRSMHSLRRQLTNATSRSTSSRRQPQPHSRSESTETIQVLMQTPDHGAQFPASRPTPHADYYHRTSSGSWESAESEDTTPIEEEPAVRQSVVMSTSPPQKTNLRSTPTRPGRNSAGDIGITLGTPFTPSNFNPGVARNAGLAVPSAGLTVEREPMKRDTTFSAMMERAGFRKEDLIGNGGASSSSNVQAQRRHD